MPALAGATRWNPVLRALRQRLITRGKAPNSAIVACARKLLVMAHAVVARGTPWQNRTTQPWPPYPHHNAYHKRNDLHGCCIGTPPPQSSKAAKTRLLRLETGKGHIHQGVGAASGATGRRGQLHASRIRAERLSAQHGRPPRQPHAQPSRSPGCLIARAGSRHTRPGLAANPTVSSFNGEYFFDRKISPVARSADHRILTAEFWALSDHLLKCCLATNSQ